MNEALTFNMVTQVTEEKMPTVYKPFLFANQIFIVAEQLTRKIEHIASFSFGILTGNGEILKIDPSLNWTLFSIFISQIEQYGSNTNATPIPSLVPIVQQPSVVQTNPMRFPLEFKNIPCEKMDTTPDKFTCTKSTSSTELTSQNVTSSHDTHGSEKYVVLDFSKARIPFSEVFKNIDECTQNCLKMNAREQLKLRKSRFDNSFF